MLDWIKNKFRKQTSESITQCFFISTETPITFDRIRFFNGKKVVKSEKFEKTIVPYGDYLVLTLEIRKGGKNNA